MTALLCPPHHEERLLSNLFARLQERWSNQSRLGRELLMSVAALAFGLLLLPWFIWAAGQIFLGAYAGGSVWRFIGSFFTGLAQGSLVFWIVALGPLAFLVLIRLFIGVASTPKS